MLAIHRGEHTEILGQAWEACVLGQHGIEAYARAEAPATHKVLRVVGEVLADELNAGVAQDFLHSEDELEFLVKSVECCASPIHERDADCVVLRPREAYTSDMARDGFNVSRNRDFCLRSVEAA